MGKRRRDSDEIPVVPDDSKKQDKRDYKLSRIESKATLALAKSEKRKALVSLIKWGLVALAVIYFGSKMAGGGGVGDPAASAGSASNTVGMGRPGFRIYEIVFIFFTENRQGEPATAGTAWYKALCTARPPPTIRRGCPPAPPVRPPPGRCGPRSGWWTGGGR